SGSASLTVSKATLTVTADNQSRTYGAANPAFTSQISGFKNGETASVLTTQPACASSATASSPVGTYAITRSGGAATNYTFSYVNGTLTITKATLTVTANDKTRAYGDANPAFDAAITGFKNSETLATSGVTGSPSCSTTATAASSVSGSPYPISCIIGT